MRKLKKIQTKLSFAILAIMTSVPAFADPLCDLIKEMSGVFKILRTLAFVGAAFIIAGWAWGFIKDAKVDMDDLRKKGTGMLVGFILLFTIGIVLSFFLSQAGGDLLGCKDEILNWGK